MKSRPWSLILFAVALIAVCYGWWIFLSGEVFVTHSGNSANRAALMRIRAAIEPGDSYEAVLSAYWRAENNALRLHVESSTEWIIGMPTEFGATNWTLRVGFERGKVDFVNVRTADGPAPDGGPPDKTAAR